MNYCKEKYSEEEIRYQIELNRVSQNDWMNISFYQRLSEDFIREFQNNVDWISISIQQKLSDDFMKAFENKISLLNVSRYQVLSEKFIERNCKQIRWDVVSRHQKLSLEFIQKHKSHISMSHLIKNQKIEPNIFRKLENVSWVEMSKYRKMSTTFFYSLHDVLYMYCTPRVKNNPKNVIHF